MYLKLFFISLIVIILPSNNVSGKSGRENSGLGLQFSNPSYFSEEPPFTLISIQAKIMLQGNISGSNMRDDLRTYSPRLIATTCPYFGLNSFVTTASVLNVSDANNSIVDWVVMELRDAAAGHVLLARKPGLLQRDGDIVDVNGTSALSFTSAEFNPTVIPSTLFIDIVHRNHIAIRTASSQSTATGSITYDFTTALNKAYLISGDPAQMVLVGSKWCMWAGDLNTDLVSDAIDFSLTKTDFLGGVFDMYKATDLTMDGIVDALDFAVVKNTFLLGIYSSKIND